MQKASQALFHFVDMPPIIKMRTLISYGRPHGKTRRREKENVLPPKKMTQNPDRVGEGDSEREREREREAKLELAQRKVRYDHLVLEYGRRQTADGRLDS
jgi:hypothetical protein